MHYNKFVLDLRVQGIRPIPRREQVEGMTKESLIEDITKHTGGELSSLISASFADLYIIRRAFEERKRRS